MSELAPEATQEGPSAGTQLRHAREAAGLHVAALAVSLKVPVAKLEALEADRYDLLPDAVFVRALASSVCRTLKIDPQPVLVRLPRSAAPRLAQSRDGINAPFRVPGEGPRAGWSEHLTRPVTLVVGALLLGALALMLLPAISDLLDALRGEPEPRSAPAPSVSTAPADAKPAQPGPVSSPAAPQVAPLPATSAEPAVAVSPAASSARPAPAEVATVAAPTAAAPAPAAAPAVVASVPAAAAAAVTAASAPPAGLVVFRTRGPSWVEVVDARGQTVMRRLMERGEAASATGPLPLMVTVGSVGATDVQVRGRPFDLGPVSRDNVARFEVK